MVNGPNNRAALDAANRVCLHLLRYERGASDRERWTDF
jgi:hypothetical protein